MISGLYTGASGMVAQMHRMDAISNNLANVDLTGYKRDTSVHKAFPQLLIRRINDDGVYKFPFGSVDTAPVVGTLGTGVELNELYTVFEQGSMRESGNPFDLALEGEGFFVVDTPQGERYTRNGSFLIDNNGLLVTKDGYPVLGEDGVVTLKKNNFIIGPRGEIFENPEFALDPDRLVAMEENDWEELNQVDTLRIAGFRRPRYLRKQGNSMWSANPDSGEPQNIELGRTTKVVQGFLEASNVNPVTEMVNLIEVNRAYEANQRLIQAHDTTTGQLLSRVLSV